MTTTITTGAIVNRLAESFAMELEARIREALMKQASAIVHQVARDMAKALETNITARHDFGGDQTAIILRIDGVEANFSTGKP